MPLYAAIDLHSDNSALAVIDEHDVLKLRRKLPNDIVAIRSAIEGFREQLVVLRPMRHHTSVGPKLAPVCLHSTA
ncbi:MAG: hypothetical protein SGI99_11855 [Pseudomonadota bacterium]|nr:hypothetical protein [Pseudomonadota bacterium]